MHPPVEVPERLFDDDAAEQRWRGRFSAPRVTLPITARDAEGRSIYRSNASGVWEIYAWDRETDAHRQVTERPNGTYTAAVPPDGEYVWWFADKDGNEFGHWVREPFGREEEARPAVDGVTDGYPSGLDLGGTTVAVGVATDDGTTIYVATGDEPARVVYRHTEDAGVGALSRDETLLSIAHSEHGDSRHPALRVLAVADGAAVAEKWDGEGKGLTPLEFSPVPGDQRLLVGHERRGRDELLIWDVAADTEVELAIDLPGELSAMWYPDGSALLVDHTHSARTTLHRYDLATGELTTVDTERGCISGADVRADGTIEYAWSSAAEAAVVRALAPDGTDRVLLRAPGEGAAPSVDVSDAWVDGPAGQVHALVARPTGADGPLPTVFFIHGGPQAADEDRFSPARAAWVDAGFAVVQVNYRGSTGYGSAWRDAIEGRPGLTELEDIAAVHDWAVTTGLADPDRTVAVGYSWGGYLTLLALGTQPKRWAAGVAGVPVADYVAAYEDEMEPLRAFDRALFGGSPQELPDLYRECSPLSYVDAVAAPVLVVAGENDPRCPIRQVDNYLDALAAGGKRYEVYRYDAGHGSLVVAETLRQLSAEIGFIRRMLTA
ncbi:MAG TPA: alpha/beta fold hydrolase [Pseudonocardiaceae bacterium]